MTMRQLHENDALMITVTDENGRRQGILVGRLDDWCWVRWDDLDSPTTEHIGELWICENGPSLYERVVEYARAACSPRLAASA